MKTEKINSFYKIIIYGDEKVGKTQIINVFCGINFQQEYLPTFGVDYKIKKMVYNGSNIELQLIDTAGSGNFAIDLSKKFIKRTDAFIIVFDLSRSNTLKNIDCYVDKICINRNNNHRPNKIIYIVGNKCDLNTPLFIESEINEKIKEFDAKFFEVSAKKNYNINELFISIISDIENKNNIYYNCNEEVTKNIFQTNNNFEKVNNNNSSKNSTLIDNLKIENAKNDSENKENEISDGNNEKQNEVQEVRQKKCKCCPIY